MGRCDWASDVLGRDVRTGPQVLTVGEVILLAGYLRGQRPSRIRAAVTYRHSVVVSPSALLRSLNDADKEHRVYCSLVDQRLVLNPINYVFSAWGTL